jgi:glycine dehydrogenase subunit 1
MAVRAHRRSKSARILLPVTLNPAWRKVARVITEGQGLVLEELPYDPRQGTTLPESLERWTGQDITALAIQQPNFFGSSKTSMRSPTGRTRAARS